jgi:hypothetical protein
MDNAEPIAAMNDKGELITAFEVAFWMVFRCHNIKIKMAITT